MQDPRGGKVARMVFKGVFLGHVKCVLIFEFILFCFLGGGVRGRKKFPVKRSGKLGKGWMLLLIWVTIVPKG